MTELPDDAVARLHLMREAYAGAHLLEEDLAPDPWQQFAVWLDEALAAGLPEPNAMVLATADADGIVSARTVLLKGVEGGGFTFFTNRGSRKARSLAANHHASLVFPWFQMLRQVVVVGEAVELEPRRVGGVLRHPPVRLADQRLGEPAVARGPVPRPA